MKRWKGFSPLVLIADVEPHGVPVPAVPGEARLYDVIEVCKGVDHWTRAHGEEGVLRDKDQGNVAVHVGRRDGAGVQGRRGRLGHAGVQDGPGSSMLPHVALLQVVFVAPPPAFPA